MARISNLDFYALLGVHPNAEDIVIRAAFKALAQRYHPDRFNGSKDEAHRRMSDLTNAYETLADPARRRKYDRRRGLNARQARFYFKNPERERHPPFTAFALRAAARKAQLYRNAVFGLIVVVAMLSAFNVYQNAPKIKELFGWNRPAASTPDVALPTRNAPASATAPTDSAPSDSVPTSTTSNVRILPIAPVSTRPITAGTIDLPASAPPSGPPTSASTPAMPASAPVSASESAAAASAPASTPAPTPQTPEPTVAAPAPVQQSSSPLLATPAPMQQAPVPALVTAPTAPAPDIPIKASPQPAPADAQSTVAATASSTDGARKDAKRATPTKPVVAKVTEPARSTARPAVAESARAATRPVTTEPERPTARPTASDVDRCGPELVALGLCNRSGSAKGQ